MSFVDDALPAAKPVRLSVAAVKGRHGDSDSGTAFRKAFADMGSAPTSRMLDAKESGKTAVADDAAQDMPEGAKPETQIEKRPRLSLSAALTVRSSNESVKTAVADETVQDMPANEDAGTLPRMRLSSAATGRSPEARSREPNAPVNLPQDDAAPDARSTKDRTRLAKTDAADRSLETEKPDLAGKTHDASGVAKTVDRDGTSTAKATADVPAELAPYAEDPDLPLDVRELRLSLRPGIEFASSAVKVSKTPLTLAETGAGVPAGTSAMATLKASLARKTVLAKEQGANVPTTVQKLDLNGLSAATDRVSVPSKNAAVNSGVADAVAAKDEAPLTKAKTVAAQVSGSRTGASPVDPAAAIIPADAGSAGLAPTHAAKAGHSETAGGKPASTKPVDSDRPATEAAPAPSARMSLSATARHVTAEPILSTVSDRPAVDGEETSAAAAHQPEAATDVRQLLALLGQPSAVRNVSEDAAARDGRAADLGMLAVRASGDRRAGATAPSASPPAGDAPAATERKDGADQLFRFARADGKGGAVSMSVDTDGRKTIAAAADTGAAKGETVTVLDARRYLGIAPTLPAAMPLSANAQAVTSAIAGSMPLDPNAASLTGQPAGAAGKVVNTLKIQMHPIDLGPVTATMRLRDDELQVELKVQTGEAYRQLTDDQDSMIKALRAQGFAVDQVNVVFTPADGGTGRDTAQQQTPGGQQQPAQNGRDGQAGPGAESGREQRNGGSGERNTGDRRTGHDNTRETSPASQSGVSDDLYL